ncbi:DUF1918 domain-containing protein [Amycolatopsis cihanbeyliensis]|uniref:Uncharacterized protein DUF1918 n=1 Tax=Amycolatopsis cihanbeyliensis TaxID=1128664 RepID=A0A542DE04_AMYCI|nr:DUF1918 domain-containing protein [Amycolatopsis cihanbeyliensis]TQJ01308.1 uncharacterized protein DUF1918 [Amycolatopsis cihanbeyliensis]
MRAQPGDWLVVRGTATGSTDQRGQIAEIRDRDGTPPYLVRWLADDRISLIFPGPDAHVVSRAEQARLDEDERRRLIGLQAAIQAGHN